VLRKVVTECWKAECKSVKRRQKTTSFPPEVVDQKVVRFHEKKWWHERNSSTIAIVAGEMVAQQERCHGRKASKGRKLRQRIYPHPSSPYTQMAPGEIRSSRFIPSELSIREWTKNHFCLTQAKTRITIYDSISDEFAFFQASFKFRRGAYCSACWVGAVALPS
jgi:hypothetical protein